MENINLPQNQINGNIVKRQNLKVNKCQNTWYIPKEMESAKTLNMKKLQNDGINVGQNSLKNIKVMIIPELKNG